MSTTHNMDTGPSTIPHRRSKSRPTTLTLFRSLSSTASTDIESLSPLTESLGSFLGASPFLTTTTPNTSPDSFYRPHADTVFNPSNPSTASTSSGPFTNTSISTSTQPTAQTTPQPTSPVPTIDFSIISPPSTPTLRRVHPRTPSSVHCDCISQDGFGYGHITARNCDSLTSRSNPYHSADDAAVMGAHSPMRTSLCPYCAHRSAQFDPSPSKSRSPLSTKSRIYAKKQNIAKLWHSFSSSPKLTTPTSALSFSKVALTHDGTLLPSSSKRKMRSTPLRTYNGELNRREITVYSTNSTSPSHSYHANTSTLTFHTPRIYPKAQTVYNTSRSKLQIRPRRNTLSRLARAHTDTEAGTMHAYNLDYSALSPLDGEEGELIVVEDRETESDIDPDRSDNFGPIGDLYKVYPNSNEHLEQLYSPYPGRDNKQDTSSVKQGNLFANTQPSGVIPIIGQPGAGSQSVFESSVSSTSTMVGNPGSVRSVCDVFSSSWSRTDDETDDEGSSGSVYNWDAAESDVPATDADTTSGWNTAVGYGHFQSWSSPTARGADTTRASWVSQWSRIDGDIVPDLDMDVASFVSRGWRARIVSGFDILTALPPELSLLIFSSLPLPDLLSCALVCRRWAHLAGDNAVWWTVWRRAESGTEAETQGSKGNIRTMGPRSSRTSFESTEVDGENQQPWWRVEPRGWTVDLSRLRWCRGSEKVLAPVWEEHTHTCKNGSWKGPSPGFSFDSGVGIPRTRSTIIDEYSRHSSTMRAPHNSPFVSSPITINPTLDLAALSSSSVAPLSVDWRQLYKSRAMLERRWRDPEGEPKVMRIEGHADSVYCLDFDSTRIITGSRDKTIKVWSIKTGKLLGSFEGHEGSVLCLKFERDWDRKGSRMGEGDSSDESVDGKGLRGFMVSGSSDCTVCVWNLVSVPCKKWRTRYRNLHPSSSSGHGSSSDGEGRDEDGYYRSSSDADDEKSVDGIDGDVKDREEDEEENVGDVHASIRKVLRDHSGGVLDLRIDDRWIVSCAKDGLINVYCRWTLTLFRSIHGREGPVNAVGLEEGRVVSASGDGTMLLWDIETGECLREFDGHVNRGLACIQFKNDLILSGSNDCTVKLWRASTGECLHTFVGHTLLVRALYFEPTSGYIVSASYDRSVRVWEWKEGKGGERGVGRLVRVFKNLHASHIFDVRFDVGKIVSTSHDQRIVVLDFTQGIDGAELFV